MILEQQSIQELYDSYQRYRTKDPSLKIGRPSKINKMFQCFQLFWKEIIPSSISGQKKNTRSANNDNLPRNTSKFLQTSFKSDLAICRAKTDLFFIYVEDDSFEQTFKEPFQHCKVLTELSQTNYVIFLKKDLKNSECIKQLQQRQLLAEEATVYACRFNIADQLIIFGQLDLSSKEKMYFSLQKIKKQDKKYREVETNMKIKYNRSLKKEGTTNFLEKIGKYSKQVPLQQFYASY